MFPAVLDIICHIFTKVTPIICPLSFFLFFNSCSKTWASNKPSTFNCLPHFGQIYIHCLLKRNTRLIYNDSYLSSNSCWGWGWVGLWQQLIVRLSWAVTIISLLLGSLALLHLEGGRGHHVLSHHSQHNDNSWLEIKTRVLILWRPTNSYRYK